MSICKILCAKFVRAGEEFAVNCVHRQTVQCEPARSPTCEERASYDLHAPANSGEHWVDFGAAAAELPPVAAAAPSSLRVLAHPARPTIAASATRMERDLIWCMFMSV